MLNMMDQLTADKEVDVYDSVKRVRHARPEFVNNIVRLFSADSFVFSLCLLTLHFSLISVK